MSEITREAEICDHCGTDERTLGQLTRRAEAAERERDLATGQILMVGSEIGGDPKLDPMDYRDPRWTPTLEEAAKLRAEAERLRGALKALSTAERHYRDMYQCHGGQALDTGRAWDMLRKAGIEARAVLAKVKETNHTLVMRCGATLKSTIKTFRCEKGEGHDGGHRAEHHVWSDAEAPEPEYWTRLEHQAAIQLHPVFVRDMLADPRLIGQAGEDWPDGVAADAVKHARALIARLKGETE